MEHNDLFDFEVLFNGVRPEEIVVKECSFHQRCKQSENGGEAIDLAEKSVSINGVVKCIDELLDVIEELEENSDAESPENMHALAKYCNIQMDHYRELYKEMVELQRYAKENALPRPNSCLICLEDTITVPIVCVFCHNMVCCKDCLGEMYKSVDSERKIKCLRCQNEWPRGFQFYIHED